MRRPRLGDDCGSVVAEFAVALPAVVLVLVLAGGALGSGIRQIRLQDASADAARLVARGESSSRALGVLADAVPGSEAEISWPGDLVCIAASAPAGFGILTVHASSCALAGGL
ncbi:TadE family type IV pilus minor pilin [Microbacterium sp. P5_E9]